MKEKFLLGAIILLLTISCSKQDKIKELEAQIDSLKAQTAERNILPSEQPIPIGQEITVTGTIYEKPYYGPPSYGENPEEDKKLTALILRLDTPISFIGVSDDDFIPRGEVVENIEEMHMAASPYVSTEYLVNKRVKIKGNTFGSHTGYHQTKVLLDITDKNNIILVENSSISQSDNTHQIDIQNAEQVAIKFINTYTDTYELPNNLVTDNFSKLYKKWQSSDFIEYNRIVNSQDSGSNYKLSKILKTEGDSVYLLLTATQDFVGFKVTVKVTNVNGKWLIDGSGDLNIPKSLVAKN